MCWILRACLSATRNRLSWIDSVVELEMIFCSSLVVQMLSIALFHLYYMFRRLIIEKKLGGRCLSNADAFLFLVQEIAGWIALDFDVQIPQRSDTSTLGYVYARICLHSDTLCSDTLTFW